MCTRNGYDLDSLIMRGPYLHLLLRHRTFQIVPDPLPVQCAALLFPLLLWFAMFFLVARLVPPSPQRIDTYVLPSVEQMLFGDLRVRVAEAHHPILDTIAALGYVAHYVAPWLFLVYLCTRVSIGAACKFAWTIGIVTSVCTATHLIFPTAPPWFVDPTNVHVPSATADPSIGEQNAAALARVDHLTGYPVFASIYGSSTVKFGAFPSIHAAWPLLMTVHDPGLWPLFGWAYTALVWWAAVYLHHHWVLDVVCSSLYVLFGIVFGPILYTLLSAQFPIIFGAATTPQRKSRRLPLFFRYDDDGGGVELV